MKGFFLLTCLIWTFCSSIAQEVESDSTQLKEVVVPVNYPVTSEKILTKNLQSINLGQDITFLIRNSVSLVATSDAGAGIGYTGIRIRGTDATRINVTFNDIPLNDSESQAVFWVNMPDLTSSLSSIQIQRGVGTTANGTAAFGASLNLSTAENSEKPSGLIALSAGSFETQKTTLRFGTGKFAKNWSLDGGVSRIYSNGYIDRAFSNLFSFNYQLNYQKNTTTINFLHFGGREKTYQAWYGIDAQTLQNNRRFNFAGALYDDNGEITGFYPNQTDNYAQNHYHLSWKEQFSDFTALKTTLHYTKGRGFYEEYIQNAVLSDYLISSAISESDLVRRLFLDNDFFGVLSQLSYRKNNLSNVSGIAVNRYLGDHFGRVVGVVNDSNVPSDHLYYDNHARKDELSIFSKWMYYLEKLEFYADLHVRLISYQTFPKLDNALYVFREIDDSFTFFNPKAGLNYPLQNGKLYLSYALAHREPNRFDYLGNPQNPSEEILHNVELGWNHQKNRFQFSANTYLMYYENQLALSGRLDDVGNPLRENVGESYRLGLELSSSFKPNTWLNLFGNASLSTNRNLSYFIADPNDPSTGVTRETQIAFSPNFIGNVGFEVQPFKNFNIRNIVQHVGSQYMSNSNEPDSKLPSYTVWDIVLSYQKKFQNGTQLLISGLINNAANAMYSNNGYYFDQPYFYPQAGRNFLMGCQFSF